MNILYNVPKVSLCRAATARRMERGIVVAQDRRVVRTKTALTRALFELLGEKEFSKISITELAQRADVDRKTFYLHYHCVEEILEAFYEDALAQLQEGLEREQVFGEQVDMPGFFRVLNGVMAENMPLYRRLAKGSGYTYFIEQLRSVLRSAVENALVAQGNTDQTHIRMCGEFFAAGAMRVYLAWLKGELELTEEQFAQWVGRMVSQGLTQ